MSALVPPAGDGGVTAPVAGQTPGLLRRSLATGRTRAGLAITMLVVAVAVVGPFVAPGGETAIVGPPNASEVPGLLFGTDVTGRDVWTRFLHGGISVLWLSALCTLVGVGAGLLIALLAGYSRTWVDEILMRTTDVFLAFPAIVLALLFLAIFQPSAWTVILTVALGHAPRVARVMRSAVLDVAGRDYVRSAESMGLRRWSIRLGDLLPNVTGPLMVECGLRLTYSIGLVAGLGFLGLSGLAIDQADWGLMINEGRTAFTVQPWPVLLPVTAIGLLTVGTNLIADGIARAAAGTDREVGE
ncbi:MAG: ABC transporter permease [Nocardioidaceae bacterium]|nr:ABC transporter permease [Nocardioidaceae bacterium]